MTAMLKATNKPVDCSATKSRAHTLQFPGAHTYHNHRWAARLCLSTLTAKWFQIPGQSLNICTVWLISPKKPHENDLRLPFSGDCLADPSLESHQNFWFLNTSRTYQPKERQAIFNLLCQKNWINIFKSLNQYPVLINGYPNYSGK